MDTMNVCRHLTKKPQFVAFQFKIIHNRVNLASNINKLGIRNSNVCTYYKKRNIKIEDTKWSNYNVLVLNSCKYLTKYQWARIY